jgi:parallel beta-helix repeat protein
VAQVDVSVDGGFTYSKAQGTTAWGFAWTPTTPGQVTIKSRAVDDSGNQQDPPTDVTVTVKPSIRVPADQPTIQSAIDVATNGYTVLVAPGTYPEHIDFKGKAITVTSESGPQDTIIDGGNVAPVVSFISGEGRDSVINGFTLQNGRADFTNQGTAEGGGVKVMGSSPKITNNVITNNHACAGGGIGSHAGSPIIQMNTITGNNATNICPGGSGGGISIQGSPSIDSRTEILDNVISDNVSSVTGGGIFMHGATIAKRNIIKGNRVELEGEEGQGGGIWTNDVYALIVQNFITGNHASIGGGIYWYASQGLVGPIVINNTLADNDAPLMGSGIFANGYDGQAELTNNIIVAKPGQAGLHCGDSDGNIDPIIQSNNIYSAGGTAYGGTCSDMTGTNGNISANPLFTNPTQGDYHLQPGSFSIDAGDNQAPNLPDKDLDGDPRILDGDGDGTATIDMGADEFVLPPGFTLPTSRITFPGEGATVFTGITVSVTGLARDAGGGTVARVEVSVDGGATWNAATGTTAWSYDWTPTTPGPALIKSRAVDDSGNVQDPPAEITVTVQDTTPPISNITFPMAGATVLTDHVVTITGTASDVGGGTVARVEVSVDGGATYSAATGTTAWSYVWTPTTPEQATIRSRAIDGSGNVQNPPAEITVRVRTAVTIRVPSEQLTIQSAIDVTDYGDTVLVAPGTYSENINFRGKAITVKSESGPQGTIIDGGNADSVVIFTSGEGRLSTLNGFTLQNGRDLFEEGGGVKVHGSSPTITNNMIKNNGACRGGGIGISAGSPLIQLNKITSNRASFCAAGRTGGGISIEGTSSAEILDNLISENTSLQGGGIYLFGAGTSPIINRNIIKGNNADYGGGIYTESDSDALIVQNFITGNQAIDGGGLYWNVFTNGRGAILVNNTIADNNVTENGSGIFAYKSSGIKLTNNIIVAKPRQSALYFYISPDPTPPIIRFNNIFSAGGKAYGGACPDMTGTNGNISADPLFTNPTQGDYHLQQMSPSIDSGDSLTPNLPDMDLDGNPRILDGDGDGNAIIDMGADEFLLPPGFTLLTSRIIFPTAGATVLTDGTITITGAARNAVGGSVARVEVSLDGGATWSAATGTTTWSYIWTPTTPGQVTISSRAVDDSENVQNPLAEITVRVRTAVTIRVPSDQPTIQEAINAADYGDTVLVAPGTYSENINFGGKAITVRSERGPQDTIIDGGNADSVVIFTSGEGRLSTLNGFTLQNGRASSNRSFEGGGIVIQNSSPTITNNVITNNNACAGGGIGIAAGSPLIQLNKITSNSANLCAAGGTGGGISIRGASYPEILNNLISENTGLLGGGIFTKANSDGSILINNTIADNNATLNGSGIFADNPGGLTTGSDGRTELTNNIIVAKPGQFGLSCSQLSGQNQAIIRFNNIFSAGGMAYGGSCSNKTGTDGNISADPLFINPTQGDYHIQQGSPSIDAGYNQAPNLPETDIDGNPRILDGDGNGTETIDMGVDEFLLPPGLKISLLDESNGNSTNGRNPFICDLRPWTRTLSRRPKNPLSAPPPRSPRLRVE